MRIEPGHVRRLRNAFYKKQQAPVEALEQLPEPQRAVFSSEVAFHSLILHGRHDSQLDGASKLLFRTAGGQLIESVILRIASGRNSLCVSSQVGCAVRCRFCATGQMGMALNLSRDEILDQVIQANRLLSEEGRSIRNVVFMGMGEPLLNEAEVYQALDVLLSPQCFDLSPAHVLVSTVGIPDAMVRCATRFPRWGSRQACTVRCRARRESLIPLARRYPLEVLRKAMEQVTSIQGRPLMVEYLMLEGLNDTDEDLSQLIAYLRGLRVHVNLIPYNPIPEDAGLIGTAEARRRLQFAAALNSAGFTRHRPPLPAGTDIAAACGQSCATNSKRPGHSQHRSSLVFGVSATDGETPARYVAFQETTS